MKEYSFIYKEAVLVLNLYIICCIYIYMYINNFYESYRLLSCLKEFVSVGRYLNDTSLD